MEPQSIKCKDGLVFQQFLVERCIPSTVSAFATPVDDKLLIFRVYGRTANGLAVCCYVHGVRPTVTVAVPGRMTENNLLALKDLLNAAFEDKKQTLPPVTIVRLCNTQPFEFRPSATGRNILVNIYLSSIFWLGRIRAYLRMHSVQLPGFVRLSLAPVNHHNNFVRSFLEDQKISGCSWIQIPNGLFTLREKETICDMELEAHVSSLVKLEQTDGIQNAPYLILSFDLECKKSDPNCKKFVNPEVDEIAQISNVSLRNGQCEPFIKNVYAVNSCAPIEEGKVFSFGTEREMLIAWIDFVEQLNPDIYAGYNIINFDFHFILERARKLGLPKVENLGRLKTGKSSWSKLTGYKNIGVQKKSFHVEGRVVLDLFLRVYVEFRMENYKLNTASFEILRERKIHIDPKAITRLQNESDKSRGLLAKYCLQDSILPIKMILKLDLLNKYMSLATDEQIQLSDVLKCGIRKIKIDETNEPQTPPVVTPYTADPCNERTEKLTLQRSAAGNVLALSKRNNLKMMPVKRSLGLRRTATMNYQQSRNKENTTKPFKPPNQVTSNLPKKAYSASVSKSKLSVQENLENARSSNSQNPYSTTRNIRIGLSRKKK